jgi:hypothetical protein
MNKTIAMVGVLALIATSLVVAAPNQQCKKQTVFTENFSGGVEASDGDWWHHFNITENKKGKNKEYIFSGDITTFWPRARTEMNASSEFHGNYAARGVTSIEIELATIAAPQMRDYTALSPTLILVNDSGTPDDIIDDCVVFFQSGEPIPELDPNVPGTPNWTSYTFDIPSDATTLPQPNIGGGFCIPTGDPSQDTQMACWGTDEGLLCPVGHDPDLVWQTVINDVDQIKVEWMAPGWFRLIEPWQAAIDNASISQCQ